MRRLAPIAAAIVFALGWITRPAAAAEPPCATPAWLKSVPDGLVVDDCKARTWGAMDVPLPGGDKRIFGSWSVVGYRKADDSQRLDEATIRAPVVAAAIKAGGRLLSNADDHTDILLASGTAGAETYFFYHRRGGADDAEGMELRTIAVTKLTRELETKALAAPFAVDGECADPAWLVKNLRTFKRDGCSVWGWASATVSVAEGPDRIVEGRKLTVNYTLTDETQLPTQIQLQRNFLEAFKAMGATVLSPENDESRVVATQTGPAGEVWYLYQCSGGNSEGCSSFWVSTIIVDPLKQEVEAKALAGAPVIGGPCVDPPWQVHGIAAYKRTACDWRDWDVMEFGDLHLEGRHTSVTYEAIDQDRAPPSALVGRNYFNALKAIGATMDSDRPTGDLVRARQTTPAGDTWYVVQAGSGNEERRISFTVSTIVIEPLKREVTVRDMPEGVQQPAKGCADPPWLVRQFASYKLDRCDYQDFAPLTVTLPDGTDKQLAGRVLVDDYTLADDPHIRLPLAIWRNYVEALQEAGATLVTNADDLSQAILTQSQGGGDYWYIYRNGGGNSEGTSSYTLTTLQIGGPPPKGCKIEVYGVNFDFDKSVLRPESESVLQQVLALFTGTPEFVAEVGGHTDNIGTEAYNMKLSDARAAAVKTWLVAHGVAAPRMTSHGYGDTQPLVPNTSDDNRFKNRRVELKRANCK